VQNCHILITRPEPENTISCERLKMLGAHPVSLPMLEIKAIDGAEEKASIRSQIFDINEFNYVIFVSKNAARLA